MTQPETCVETRGIGDGQCYFVDSIHSNSWRQLRILNATTDWNYVEFDRTWTFNASSFDLQHYELYDVRVDPYQMNNLWVSTPDSVKRSLHQELNDFWLCKGKSCP